MDTVDIRELLERNKHTRTSFRGVFASDELPRHAPTSSLFICNTDPSSRPGEHWVVIYIDRLRHGEYFDSFGMHPSVRNFDTFMKHNCTSWIFNSRPIQDIFSHACGYHCVLYAVHRCIGYNMDDIVNLYSTDTLYNDAIAKTFVRDHVV